MKPRPYTSVHEMLAQGDTPPSSILPYDTYFNDKAGFVTFAVKGEFVSLPLSSICKASLRGDAASIILEFGSKIVAINGRRLDDLFEDILLGKVRVIRTGKHPACAVETIRISDAVLV